MMSRPLHLRFVTGVRDRIETEGITRWVAAIGSVKIQASGSNTAPIWSARRLLSDSRWAVFRLGEGLKSGSNPW